MSADIRFLARVAWFYYVEGLTQKEIAKRFGISRVKVVRLLKEARRRGIVEIRIADTWASYLPLERALRLKFGLQDAAVVETPSSPDRLRSALGKAAAEYLRYVMRPGLLV
ncbi:MAG: sigma factor-like helix-turn-helix DNA-binding protein, partial [Anaerolineae bacterium]